MNKGAYELSGHVIIPRAYSFADEDEQRIVLPENVGGVAKFGRGSDCSIRIRDGNRISRNHGNITMAGDKYVTSKDGRIRVPKFLLYDTEKKLGNDVHESLRGTLLEKTCIVRKIGGAERIILVTIQNSMGFELQHGDWISLRASEVLGTDLKYFEVARFRFAYLPRQLEREEDKEEMTMVGIAYSA